MVCKYSCSTCTNMYMTSHACLIRNSILEGFFLSGGIFRCLHTSRFVQAVYLEARKRRSALYRSSHQSEYHFFSCPTTSCAGLPCSLHQGLPCSLHQGLPCSLHQGLPCSLHQGLPCSLQQGLPCSLQQGLPCSLQHGLPCSLQHGLPCSLQHGLPCSLQQGLPCSLQPECSILKACKRLYTKLESAKYRSKGVHILFFVSLIPCFLLPILYTTNFLGKNVYFMN